MALTEAPARAALRPEALRFDAFALLTELEYTLGRYAETPRNSECSRAPWSYAMRFAQLLVAGHGDVPSGTDVATCGVGADVTTCGLRAGEAWHGLMDAHRVLLVVPNPLSKQNMCIHSWPVSTPDQQV